VNAAHIFRDADYFAPLIESLADGTLSGPEMPGSSFADYGNFAILRDVFL